MKKCDNFQIIYLNRKICNIRIFVYIYIYIVTSKTHLSNLYRLYHKCMRMHIYLSINLYYFRERLFTTMGLRAHPK